MRYALCGKNGKAWQRTRVIPYLRPDTACDLSCGCEWLRMRQTESLHVAIHRQKVQNLMAEVGESVNMTSELGVSFHSDNYAKKQNIDGKNRTEQ